MIGIFDSGVGGMTVVKEIQKLLPNYQILYFGDTARLPYGTKGEKFVKEYSKKITEWLLSKEAKIIIIACNTSSAWASESLKKEFKDIPIFEMITPAVDLALETTKNKKIGVIGTPGTVKSGAYLKKFAKRDKKVKVFSVACPLFVPLVEEGFLKDDVTYEAIKKSLLPLKNKKIDTLVLGCTHYPLLKAAIEKTIAENIKVINPAEKLAREIKEFLRNNPEVEKAIKKGNKHQFFFSDEPYNLEKISRLCFSKKMKATINDPF